MAGKDIPTVGQVCPECGFLHPIIPGKKCPMAKEKTSSGISIDFNPFFGDLKTILVSQFEKKEIKDPKKFFGYALVKITKLLEEYRE